MRILLTLLLPLFSGIVLAQKAADFTLTSTDEVPFSLYEDHLNQGNTVVLEIFFVDCPPCRRLAPQMATLHKKMVAEEVDVEFISISISTGDTNERIAGFKTEFEHDWPFFRRTPESEAVLAPYQDGTFGTYFGTPTTLVIGPDGSVFNVRGNIGTEGDWTGKLETKIKETQAGKEEIPTEMPPATAIVTGGINTTKGEGLAGVTINFSGAKDTTIVSGAMGAFATGNLLADTSYTVSLEKNDDVTNGVTTLDIVFISKHILGIDTFTQDFQAIAADVNNSGSVTTFDLVQIRQVILGIIDAFPNRDSWVFMPNQVEISALQELDALAFTAIKIGDLNESAKADGLLTATERSSVGDLNIYTKDQTFKAGEVVEVTLSGKELSQIQGFQFTVDFDPNTLQLNDLSKGNLPNFSLANINLNQHNRGLISTSWNGLAATNAAQLFNLSFTALADGRLSDLLKINAQLTTAEGYNLADEALDVRLVFQPASSPPTATLLAYPNPIDSDELHLSFDNPQAQRIRVDITNLQGQLVRSQHFELSDGAQVLTIGVAHLEVGVFTVNLWAGQRLLQTTPLIRQ